MASSGNSASHAAPLPSAHNFLNEICVRLGHIVDYDGLLLEPRFSSVASEVIELCMAVFDTRLELETLFVRDGGFRGNVESLWKLTGELLKQVREMKGADKKLQDSIVTKMSWLMSQVDEAIPDWRSKNQLQKQQQQQPTTAHNFLTETASRRSHRSKTWPLSKDEEKAQHSISHRTARRYGIVDRDEFNARLRSLWEQRIGAQ